MTPLCPLALAAMRHEAEHLPRAERNAEDAETEDPLHNIEKMWSIFWLPCVGSYEAH